MNFGVCLFVMLVVVASTYEAQGQECQTGERRIEECNTCTCARGRWACTRKYCFTKRSVPECQPGERKQVDCNTCFCAGGVFACTKIQCLRKREAIAPRFNSQLSRPRRDDTLAAELATTPCAPNDYFQVDCNTCYCKMDRTGYLCTENLCHGRHYELSTTSRIPLTNDSVLIVSNKGATLIENLNSNDNSISRIPKSVKPEDANISKFLGHMASNARELQAAIKNGSLIIEVDN